VVERILYLLMVVAVGWAVTFGLRSLPFLVFAGRNRTLPPWVERLGRVISPVIIGGLIVYSYSGLEWMTLWPYVAGALTVGLQLWKRNPLVSIVAGTVLYMCLLTCGCATQRTVSDLDAEHPELRLAQDGVYMGETRLRANEVVETLEDADIPKDRPIRILLDRDMRDLRAGRALINLLALGGYDQASLVTPEHGETKTKSGNTYAEAAAMERRNDIDFFITENNVTFGLLTSVLPQDVVPCLKHYKVGCEQLIRLNCYKKDEHNSRVLQNFDIIENILHQAGYKNTARCAIDDRQKTSAVAAPKRDKKSTIRYKKAKE